MWLRHAFKTMTLDQFDKPTKTRLHVCRKSFNLVSNAVVEHLNDPRHQIRLLHFCNEGNNVTVERARQCQGDIDRKQRLASTGPATNQNGRGLPPRQALNKSPATAENDVEPQIAGRNLSNHVALLKCARTDSRTARSRRSPTLPAKIDGSSVRASSAACSSSDSISHIGSMRSRSSSARGSPTSSRSTIARSSVKYALKRGPAAMRASMWLVSCLVQQHTLKTPIFEVAQRRHAWRDRWGPNVGTGMQHEASSDEWRKSNLALDLSLLVSWGEPFDGSAHATESLETPTYLQSRDRRPYPQGPSLQTPHQACACPARPTAHRRPSESLPENIHDLLVSALFPNLVPGRLAHLPISLRRKSSRPPRGDGPQHRRNQNQSA